MSVDERGRSARASVLRDLEQIAVPPAAGVVRRVRSRRRARAMAAAGAIAVVALLPTFLLAQRTEDAPVDVSGNDALTDLPAGSVVSGAWASIPKRAAGFGGTTGFRTIVSTGSSLVAGGSGIWRSIDGVHWTSVAPRTLSGPVTAIAARGSTLVGVAGDDGDIQILSSSDDGQTWSVSPTNDFGPPAPQMGRPSVSSLLWSASARSWVAGGGASAGAGAVWMSSDGRDWRAVHEPGAVGSADVVPDGFGGFLSWWADRVWLSPDHGRTWSPDATSTLPPRTYLSSLAPGGVLGAGRDVEFSTPATPLLRSADRGRTWLADAASMLGLTVVQDFSHDNGVWAAGGYRSSDDRPAAWISTDSVRWIGLPPSLQRAGRGSLTQSATLGSTTVFLSDAARLDRFFVVDATSAGLTPSSPCPGSVPRRLVDGAVPDGGDPLPPLDDAALASAAVEQTLAAHEADLRRRYPQLSRAEVGPGFGAAWEGENGGASRVVLVDDHAVIVHLPSAAACPEPPDLHGELAGVPLFFVVDR